MTGAKQESGNGAGVGVLEHIKPGDLKDSPFNIRKSYTSESIEAIASTAKDVGILETLMARPVGKGDKGRELVFGHRRKRAALLVKLETVPVLVKPMADKDVRLVQMIENGSREDVHPLEEADGYRALVETDGMQVADISAALAKPAPYIYRRLALVALCPKGREAFKAGKMRTGVAELIARLADEKAQARAVKDLAGLDHQGALVTVAAARRAIERDYLRELKGAPFSPKAADLLESVGPCTTCPKRTGSNADLFGDLQGANVCTDGVCFEEKARAAWKIKSKEHKAAGGQVLDKKETAKAFPYKHNASLPFDGKWVDLDAAPSYGAASYRKTIKEAKGELPPVTLARDPDGKTRALVVKADLSKAMRGIGGGGKKKGDGVSSPAMTPTQKKKQDRERHEAEVKRRVGRLGAAMLATKMKPDHLSAVGFWSVLAELSIRGAWHDTCRDTCKRRELDVPKGARPEEVLLEHVKAIADGTATPDREATTCELLAVLTLEMMTRGEAETNGESWKVAAGYLGIKREAIEKRARTELAEAKKAKAKGKPAQVVCAGCGEKRKSGGTIKGGDGKTRCGPCHRTAASEDPAGLAPKPKAKKKATKKKAKVKAKKAAAVK